MSDLRQGAQDLLWSPAMVGIPLHTPGEPLASGGIGTETEKTFTSRSRGKHRELPIGQTQIKRDL